MKKFCFSAVVVAVVFLAGCGSSPKKGGEETPRRQDVINVAETRAPVLSVVSVTARDTSAVLKASVVCEAGGQYWFEVTRQRDGFIHEFARSPCPTGKKSIPVEYEAKGLSPNTDYFAQARAEDSKRRLATSRHLEFRTGAVPIRATEKKESSPPAAAKVEPKPAPTQPRPPVPAKVTDSKPAQPPASAAKEKEKPVPQKPAAKPADAVVAKPAKPDSFFRSAEKCKEAYGAGKYAYYEPHFLIHAGREPVDGKTKVAAPLPKDACVFMETVPGWRWVVEKKGTEFRYKKVNGVVSDTPYAHHKCGNRVKESIAVGA